MQYTNLTPDQIMDKMVKAGIIPHKNSGIGAVQVIREAAYDAEQVNGLVKTVLGFDPYNKHVADFGGPMGDDPRERFIVNQYVLSYMGYNLCRMNMLHPEETDKVSAANAEMKQILEKAFDTGKRRLYGDLKFIGTSLDKPADAVQKSADGAQKSDNKALTATKSKASTTVNTRGKGVPAAPKVGGKVDRIFTSVARLYRDEKKDKDETITAIMAEYAITNRVTAATYFNDAIRFHAIPKR